MTMKTSTMRSSAARPLRRTASPAEAGDAGWKWLYRIGGAAALLSVLVSLLDIFVSLVSKEADAEPGSLTATDWFALLQHKPFLGLRNLGLFNVINTALAVPLYLALYAAHRRAARACAALAAILSFIGTAIYIASNKALPMLALSDQYAAATTDSRKSMLAAAGQAMLAQGEDFTPGSFMGFLFAEVAGIVMGIAMLRSRIFSRLTAWTGMLGSGLLLIFTTWTTFVAARFEAAMLVAMGGGLLSMAWLVLVARRLVQLGRARSAGEHKRTSERR
jgi:hypothetical protein